VQPKPPLSGFFHCPKGNIMAVKLPNGSIVAIAAAYDAVRAMSAVTNANPGVATLAASHGVVTGDFMEVTSGWARLNNRIIRAGTVATNSVPLENMNTTSVVAFPAGSGVGSVRKVNSFTQLTQIVGSGSEGGEQQFTTYQFLEADSEVRIPTNKSAAGINFTVADDPTLLGYQLAQAANEDRLARAVRITFPDGSLMVFNAYISLAPMPTLAVNEVMTVQVTMSLLAAPVRYLATP